MQATPDRVVIFLDIDEVLNSVKHRLAGYSSLSYLDPVAVRLVARLAELADADIVISSSWRKIHSLETIRERLNSLTVDGLIASRIISVTPIDPSEKRGREIQTWRDAQGHAGPYIIIDDSRTGFSPAQYAEHLVWCHPSDGFGFREYVLALRLLERRCALVHPELDKLAPYTELQVVNPSRVVVDAGALQMALNMLRRSPSDAAREAATLLEATAG